MERYLTGDFDALLCHLHHGILDKSTSASYEGGSDYQGANGFRCSVRVYDRYSLSSGSRVSLHLTLIGEGMRLFLAAITSGGSRAVLFKLNTLGERTFLDVVADLLREWKSLDVEKAIPAPDTRRPCPCCGNYTLNAETPGNYEVCPVCFWIDDPQAAENPDIVVGCNEISLSEARRNYQVLGACTAEMCAQVRPPAPEELPEVYQRMYETGS